MKHSFSIIAVYFFFFFSLFSSSVCFANKEEIQSAKNIILFIADGMGFNSISAARYYKKPHAIQWLHIESFPQIGIVRTHAAYDRVTDSAAAATAMAIGCKTNHGVLGYCSTSQTKIDTKTIRKNLFEIAFENNKNLGIITTTHVGDATPAAFYARSSSRKNFQEITKQLLDSKLSFILGGGRKSFYPSTWEDPESKEKGERKDELNLIKSLEKKGWKYVESQKQLIALKPTESLPVIGLFEYENMQYELDRKSDQLGEPSLTEMVEWGTKYLQAKKISEKNGFFLVVESGRIDHAAHYNYGAHYLSEILQLDESVKKADSLTNDQDTLIIVVSDHETGGFSFNGYDSSPFKSVLSPLGNVTDPKTISTRRKRSIITWATGPGHLDVSNKNDKSQQKSAHLMNKATHTASDVPIMAKGINSELFTGFMDNTHIFSKLNQILRNQVNSKE